MSRPYQTIYIPLRAVVFIVVLALAHMVSGDIIAISDTTPDGTSSVVTNKKFIGLLDSIAPNQISGTELQFTNPPAGETFALGDLVGQDLDATSGSRSWSYMLSLPLDATLGTGLTDIQFNAHSFERDKDNLEDDDQLKWELFVNGNLVGIDGPAAGSDWTTYDTYLFHAGGSTVTDVEVVFTANGFNTNNEWFATRGILTANYDQVLSIPEPTGLLLMLVGLLPLACRRRRRRV